MSICFNILVSELVNSSTHIITFGGEEDNPPEFGKVKIAIKPDNASTISSYTKNEIVNKVINAISDNPELSLAYKIKYNLL